MSRCMAPMLRMYTMMTQARVTKDSLKEVWVLPEWNIALRMAQSMNIICCIMVYSGGMPILYAIGFLYCMLAYWLDKYALLRGSRRPPGYSAAIIKACMALIPLAAFLHSIFSGFVLGNPRVFP